MKIHSDIGVINFEIFFFQLTARIQRAQVTVSVQTVHASVRRDGKDLIAVQWIRTPYNAYRTVRHMEALILINKFACANRGGLVTIVRKSYAI